MPIFERQEVPVSICVNDYLCVLAQKYFSVGSSEGVPDPHENSYVTMSCGTTPGLLSWGTLMSTQRNPSIYISREQFHCVFSSMNNLSDSGVWLWLRTTEDQADLLRTEESFCLQRLLLWHHICRLKGKFVSAISHLENWQYGSKSHKMIAQGQVR